VLRGADIAAAQVREHVLGLISEHWGLGSDVLADIFAPDADAATRQAFVRYQREAATPQTARAMLALAYDLDITDLLANVQAPTLVVHRDQDRAATLEQGRALAAGIPGARWQVVTGRNHLPYIGDRDTIAHAVRSFLGLSPLRSVPGASVTRRQYEVAQLVAQGLTNRDSADRLGISERSAESHVERIRDRLGFRSRSQIAAWVIAGGR
jgi:DNA-binding CsgD family transcriptional regulator